MTRFWTRHVSRLLIAALLPAQALVASHACGRMGGEPVHRIASAASTAVGTAMADGEADCDAASPVCQKHCENEPGAMDSASTSVCPAFIAAFEIHLADAGIEPILERPADPALCHATSPPPAIRHCCWRI